MKRFLDICELKRFSSVVKIPGWACVQSKINTEGSLFTASGVKAYFAEEKPFSDTAELVFLD